MKWIALLLILLVTSCSGYRPLYIDQPTQERTIKQKNCEYPKYEHKNH